MQPNHPSEDPRPKPSSGGFPGETPGNGMGIASMVLGIGSIPLVCCFGLGGLLGVAAAVLGFLGKQKADQGLATNRGQAITGLVSGLVAVGFGLLYLILVIIANVIEVETLGAG